MTIACYRSLLSTSSETLRSLFLLPWLLIINVDISRPLHYVIIMNRTRCNLLLLVAWAIGAVHAFPHFFYGNQVNFLWSQWNGSLFLWYFPLLKIACTDTYITCDYNPCDCLFRYDCLRYLCSIICFLWNYIIHLKKSFGCWKTKSPFYLWISNHHSHLIFVSLLLLFILGLPLHFLKTQ